mmetsp:Transcript_1585/g.2164  ORF Transcript_1585/g.2164 Transcript_1585/m.2164 type:complete len:164 (+) Transcript_1585:408-899(+)
MSYLSRKQKWRRCKARTFSKKDEKSVSFSHIFSSPEWEDLLPQQSSRPIKSDSWSHPRRLFPQEMKEECNDTDRKVNFDDNVRVVLIPSHKDFDVMVPHNTIWWTKDDYETFKLNALRILEVYGNLGASDDEVNFEDSQKKVDKSISLYENGILGQFPAESAV